MNRVFGIDFGTTHTLIAYMTPSGPKVVLGSDGRSLIPSVVALLHGSLYIGGDAKYSADTFVNGGGVKEIKRMIGSGQPVMLGGQQLAPREVAALIIGKAKDNAERDLKEAVERAVITVPATFTDLQRREIEEAARIAGLKVERIINEPTAAVLAYAYRTGAKNKTVLCYDFGGGTFDVSVVRIDSQGGVEVLSVGGDRRLGGKEIDEALFRIAKRDFETGKGCELSKQGEYRLLLESEKIKIALSEQASATFNVSLQTSDGRSILYFKKFERAELEQITTPIVARTADIAAQVLADSGLEASRLDDILLVGGSSRMPIVKRELKRTLGKEPSSADLAADESVALGAAIEAGKLVPLTSGMSPGVVSDLSPYIIGLSVMKNGKDDVFEAIIHKNSYYGRQYPVTFWTAYDYQVSMKLKIYQGEHPTASKNEFVGEFNVEGIPSNKAGRESVIVTFAYSDSGMLSIHASIPSAGKEVRFALQHDRSFSPRATQASRTRISEILNQVRAQSGPASNSSMSQIDRKDREDRMAYLQRLKQSMND